MQVSSRELGEKRGQCSSDHTYTHQMRESGNHVPNLIEGIKQ